MERDGNNWLDRLTWAAAGAAVTGLLALAILPWLVNALANRPMVPEELVARPTLYRATVDAAQEATTAAQRQATLAPVVVVIGTVAAPATNTPIIVGKAAASLTPAFSRATPAATTAAGVTLAGDSSGQPATPGGMTVVEDTITEAALAEQIRQDAGADSLSAMTVTLSPDGVAAASIVTALPGVELHLSASGAFSVKNYILVVHIDVVELDGRDVTDLYGSRLESQINTSLYRLLPQRYVQSFVMEVGQVRILSLVQP